MCRTQADRKAVFQTLSRADLLKFNASKKERMVCVCVCVLCVLMCTHVYLMCILCVSCVFLECNASKKERMVCVCVCVCVSYEF